MLWKRLLATLAEEGDKESDKTNIQTIDKEKENVGNSTETSNESTKAEKLQDGENKTEQKSNESNDNSEESLNDSDKSQSQNKDKLKDNTGSKDNATNLTQPTSQRSSPLENRRRSLSSGNRQRRLLENQSRSLPKSSDKTPPINPVLLNRRRHSDLGIRSSTPLDEKTVLSNVKVPILNNRRLSASTIGKLGVSEYGRNALRFKSLGDKIWKMIRVKNVFSLKNDDDDSQLFDYKENNANEIRFSTSLSPEAQLALIQGYEDKNYEEITKLYPESKRLLKRPRTPVSLISNTDDNTSQNGAWQKLCKTKIDVITAFSIHNNDYDSPLRRRKPSAETIPNFADLFRPDKVPVGRETSNSPLPVPVSDDKRRIISYRLQNAMDILDTLKYSAGQHTVSPRLKTYQSPISPVKAYNKWTDLWKTDFKSVQVK